MRGRKCLVTMLCVLMVGMLMLGITFRDYRSHADQSKLASFGGGGVLGQKKHLLTRQEMKQKILPELYQTDDRWSQKTYGDDVMEVTGCGPTCLAMILKGLGVNPDTTPYRVAKWAEKQGYYVSGSGSAWNLMSEGAQRLGLDAEELSLDESVIRRYLEQGEPIICIMRPGDFTTCGHFVVLTGELEDGTILVNDPNSEENSHVAWELDRLMGQIKNLWGYSAA